MIPHANTVKYKIGQWLHLNPSSTHQQVWESMRSRRSPLVFGFINEMICDGMLINEGGKLALGKAMQRHFDQLSAEEEQKPKLEIVPARTAPEFRPLSAKNMAHLAPRREPIRQNVSFINGSAGFQGYRA